MLINNRIIETVAIIDNLTAECVNASRIGNYYRAGQYCAAARDTCEALADRIGKLAAALKESGYSDNRGYNDFSNSLMVMANKLADKVIEFESKVTI